MTTVLAVWGACAAPESPPAPTVHTAETDDRDGDGFGRNDDCDDADATVFPGAPDPEGDGVDQSCDGLDGVPAPLPRGECLSGDRGQLRLGYALDLDMPAEPATPRLLVGSAEWRWVGESYQPGPGRVEVWDLERHPTFVGRWEGDERGATGVGTNVAWSGDDWFAATAGLVVRCRGGRVGPCAPAAFDPAGDWRFVASPGADLDLDGADDVVVTSNDEDHAMVLFGPGFGASTALPGQVDVVVRRRGDTVGVMTHSGAWEGPTTHTWSAAPLPRGGPAPVAASWTLAGRSRTVEVGDLDGDGAVELVASDVVGVEPAGIRGLPPGTDPEAAVWAVGPLHGGVSALAVGDLDGDGSDDLVAAVGPEGAVVAVWFGPLVGAPPGPDTAWTVGSTVSALVVGDADGDGDADLMVGAPGATLGTLVEAGEVCVIRGPVARP